MRAGQSLLLIATATLCGCPTSPNGKIDETSKTPACSAELRGALEATKRELGFGYEVAEGDGDTLMNTGTIAKRYARDGVKVSLDFGLAPQDTGCSLVAYKMTRTEPGRSTTSGTQGRVPLTQCTCSAAEE